MQIDRGRLDGFRADQSAVTARSTLLRSNSTAVVCRSTWGVTGFFSGDVMSRPTPSAAACAASSATTGALCAGTAGTRS